MLEFIGQKISSIFFCDALWCRRIFCRRYFGISHSLEKGIIPKCRQVYTFIYTRVYCALLCRWGFSTTFNGWYCWSTTDFIAILWPDVVVAINDRGNAKTGFGPLFVFAPYKWLHELIYWLNKVWSFID